MALSTGLIIKGLLGAGATCTAITCIVKKDDIHNWLFRIEEKKKSLGLPSKCEWPTEVGTSKECTELTGETDLKGINFDGKGDAPLTVEGDTSGKATLTIEKVSDSDFPKDYKFIFKSESTTGITLKKGNDVFITFGKDMNLEFKIKEDGGKWSLEKAWDGKKLLSKLGIKDCGNENNKCTIPQNQKINVKLTDENKTATDLKVTAEGKICFSDNKVNYNQGFEFTPESDITLSEGNPSSTIDKLEKSKKYQIIKDGDKWYLSQKS